LNLADFIKYALELEIYQTCIASNFSFWLDTKLQLELKNSGPNIKFVSLKNWLKLLSLYMLLLLLFTSQSKCSQNSIIQSISCHCLCSFNTLCHRFHVQDRKKRKLDWKLLWPGGVGGPEWHLRSCYTRQTLEIIVCILTLNDGT